MTKIGILFFSGPYQAQAAETVCKIAKAALDKGHEVRIFCYMDAVHVLLPNQKKLEGIYNIEEGFRELLERGAIVRLCNLCLLVRGTVKLCISKKDIEGADVKRGGTPDLAGMVKQTDKLIIIN